MDAPGVGVGQNEGFVYQARAFLEEVAGLDEADSLPRCATFDEGVHNMEVLAAVPSPPPAAGRRWRSRPSAALATARRGGLRDEVRRLQRDPARPVPS